jgi:hypothetical protein
VCRLFHDVWLVRAENEAEAKQKKSKFLRCFVKQKRDGERLYETEVLDQTLRRIAALLQVGFGDAGAQIIAQNLKVCTAFCVRAAICVVCVDAGCG